MNSVTREVLRKVIAFRDLPDDHLQWILERSEYKEFLDGQEIVRKGDPMEHMWILLDGAAPFYMDINGSQVHFYDFTNDELSGGVGGVLPYSRMLTSPGYSYASGTVKCLLLHKKHFPELEQLNQVLTQRLIASMTNRARIFATQQLQQEKINALGKLSAGIAHELNNPASAVNRISQELTQRLIRNFELTEKLFYHQINHSQIKYLRALVQERVSVKPVTNRITPLQRMELEDDTRSWLEHRNIPNAEALSEAFVETGVTIMELEQVCEMAEETACADVLSWLENLITSQKIINDLEEASSRISTLVGAIKNHVHLDRSGGMQPTDIRDDIENTVTLMGHKFREKKIEVIREYQIQEAKAEAIRSELNQVWMNLMDNAIHAMEVNGKFVIRIYQNNNDLKVHFIDNGKGIPQEIMNRIFDPFFTTKKAGEGTGMGLDFVRKIIAGHHGDIKVFSQPGKTEFVICLPQRQPVANT